MCFLLLIIPKFCFHGGLSFDIFQTCLFCGVFVDVSKGCFFVAFPLWQSSLHSLGSTLFPCSKCKKNSCILIEVNHTDSIGKFILLFVKFVGINCLCVLCPRLVAEVQTVCNSLEYNHVTHFDLDVGTRFWFILWAQGMWVFHILKKGNTLDTSKSCLWDHLMCNSFAWIVG